MLKKTILLGLLLCSTIVIKAQYNDDQETQIQSPENEIQDYDELVIEMAKTIQTANYDCQNEDAEVVKYEDSIYIDRLYTLPSTMELVFNPSVKSFIEMYARRHKQVGYMLGEGEYLFPLFEQALEKEGVPLELKYLPVIESALNPTAKSRAGAMGLWQFMPATARMFDLEINSLVDERRDPQKSTDAAAKYLKYLYNIYGDWNLVIAAYNCGPGNVNKAIRRSGGQTDYWTIYPYLPKETRSYVPIFIAATYIMNYYDSHNICPQISTRPVSMDTLMIDKNVHFEQISNVLDIPIEDIRKYNPQFKNDIIPGAYKNYALTLPIDYITAFIDKKDDILNYKAQELLSQRKIAGLDATSDSGSSTIVHKVKKGDTLSGISRKYGITLAQLKKWNKLKSNNVPIGKRLTIYKNTPKSKAKPSTNEHLASANTTTQKATSNSNKATTSTTSKSKKSVVDSMPVDVSMVQGDNYYGNSGTVVVDAESQLGGKTNISGRPQKTQKEIKTETTTTYYKVKKGDTWTGVARKNNATIKDLKQWNNIKNNTLIAGKTLKILKTRQIEIEVPVEEPLLNEPQLASVEIDSVLANDAINDYISKVNKDNSTLPIIQISGSDTENSSRSNSSDELRTIYHKVRIGETITQIAAQYNVSKDDIVSWNKLSSKTAKVGQRLLIRLPEVAKEDAKKNTSNTASTLN